MNITEGNKINPTCKWVVQHLSALNLGKLLLNVPVDTQELFKTSENKYLIIKFCTTAILTFTCHL